MQLYTLLQWYVVIRITFGCAKKKEMRLRTTSIIYIYVYTLPEANSGSKAPENGQIGIWKIGPVFWGQL